MFYRSAVNRLMSVAVLMAFTDNLQYAGSSGAVSSNSIGAQPEDSPEAPHGLSSPYRESKAGPQLPCMPELQHFEATHMPPHFISSLR
jgi:hypothetical protein